jgi:hypothetical protein
MRYYDLDVNGRVTGDYAVLQPDKTLYPLEDRIDDTYMRNGVPGDAWIVDTVLVAARQAEADKVSKKHQAIIDNLPSWAQVDAAITAISNLADAKAFLRKLARLVYWDLKNEEN